MDRYKYMQIHADLIPEACKEAYNLWDKVYNGHIYMEIRLNTLREPYPLTERFPPIEQTINQRHPAYPWLILFYSRATDPFIPHALSKLATQQSNA
eukprot:CCRYP_021178-RA/>CCRYP_021178-RA protein AED:0.48 eAED:0.48 QI:0/0/0/1/0/0/2/0/95